MNKEIYERLLLNQLALLEALVVALPLGNRRNVQDSIVQTEMMLRKLETMKEPKVYHVDTSKPIDFRGGSGIMPVDVGPYSTGGGAGVSQPEGLQPPETDVP